MVIKRLDQPVSDAPEAWDALTGVLEAVFVDKSKDNFFIVPLPLIEKLKELRKEKKDYTSPAILLITDTTQLPVRVNRESPYLEALFGNPEFGNICQAIFRAEVIRVDQHGRPSLSEKAVPLNMIEVLGDDPVGEVEQCMEKLRQADVAPLCMKMGMFRESFYKAYIDYYDDFESAHISLLDQAHVILTKARTGELNDKDTHSRSKEFIRAPLPFYLQELAETSVKLKEVANGNEKIRLILIDNQAGIEGDNDKKNKFIKKVNGKKYKAGSLCELLSSKEILGQDLSGLFSITMLGDFSFVNGKFGCESDSFVPEDHAFNSKRFWGKPDDYRREVLEKIKKSHFVLLDFFLDDNNTCLAFDFIRELNRIKRDGNDHSTTWYFIASAVHDSVTRYSQSGLLAEYYESAVVNAGDDPTNEKRQIIFLYKLLTFVHARIRSVQRHYDHVLDWIFIPKKDGHAGGHDGCDACENDSAQAARCLNGVQRAIKRFLAENESFAGQVMQEYEAKRWLMTLLDDTITKFKTLPHADWQMVAHQIEAINIKFGDISGNGESGRKFACKYIIRELKDRGEKF